MASTTPTANGAPNGNGEGPARFGTFGGVFTPSILTILGVIMFMRAGFVVGQSGIVQALLILAIAKSISILTAFSISAIATNTEVKGGGAYYLISRTLGPEFGGTIGLALYCAQALSVPFYVLGFTEALCSTFPGLAPYAPHVTVITLGLLFAVTCFGAGWAIKTQYVIMGALVVSILAFMGGLALKFSPATFSTNLSSGYRDSMGFWSTFAIYFPAVTGIMAGVNMSGDLKNPSKSLPWGTFAAIGVGMLIYGGQTLLMGGAIDREIMIANPFGSLCDAASVPTPWFTIRLGGLVVLGVWAATLSSALGSFLGAPRILQALAQDDILKPLKLFARVSREGEPHRALILTWAVGIAVLWWAAFAQGDALNHISTFVTMLFLCAYGITNLAAFVESFGRNPSFRPRFKFFHWSLALGGAAGCVFAASLVHPGFALLAALIIALLFFVVRKFVLTTSFGDARRGFVYSRIRDNLLRLGQLPSHPKNWRPTSLVLTGNPNSRLTLVKYAIWTSSGRGIVTLVAFVVGDMSERFEERTRMLSSLEEFIDDNELEAFPQVIVTPDFDWGLNQLLQYGGAVGPLKPNMVVLGFPTDPQRAERFVRHLKTAHQLGLSLMVIRDAGPPALRHKKPKTIDIWWRGRDNGSLMVIIGYLISLNHEWSGATIRVLRVVPTEKARQASLDELKRLIESARLDAQIHVIMTDKPFKQTLYEYSHKSTVVCMGFRIPDESEAGRFQSSFDDLLQGLPTTLLVHSTGEADLTS